MFKFVIEPVFTSSGKTAFDGKATECVPLTQLVVGQGMLFKVKHPTAKAPDGVKIIRTSPIKAINEVTKDYAMFTTEHSQYKLHLLRG